MQTCTSLTLRPSAWSASCYRRSARRLVSVRAEADFCDLPMYREAPDMDKRRTLNALVLGACALPTAHMAGTYLYSLVPVR